MARVFKLDRAGGGEVLKEIAAQVVAQLGERLADRAGTDATLTLSTSDRARASVSVPAYQQASDGVLTKAAAELGLQVRPSKKRPPKPRRGN